MGLMDKVKAQATVLADKAQTGLQQGQTKIQEMQSGKQADHLLRQLGAYVFLSERGRNQPDSEAKVAAIMNELDALESAGTEVTVTSESPAAPAGDSNPGAPQSGPNPAPPQSGPIPGTPQSGAPIPKSGDNLPG